VSGATVSLARAFEAIVGPAHVSVDETALIAEAIDGQSPKWIVRPRALDEVSRILALAHDEGLAVIPRGSGSALELGHPVTRLDLLLDLAELNHVVEYNPDDLTITVQVTDRPMGLGDADAGWRDRDECEWSAPGALRHDARSPARRPLRPSRWRHHLGRRQGRQVGLGL